MTRYENSKRWDSLTDTYGALEQENQLFPIDPQFLPPQGSTILDIGCGTGTHMSLFQTRSTMVFGVDISFNMALKASRYGHVARADVGALPFPAQIFDYLWSRVVLSHIDDWQKGLSESWRVLSKEGTMVLLVANRWSLMTPFRSILSWLGLYSLGRCRHFSIKEIRRQEFLSGAYLTACFAVFKKASSENLISYVISNMLHAGDAILGKFFKRWGGDLCLVLKKKAQE